MIAATRHALTLACVLLVAAGCDRQSPREHSSVSSSESRGTETTHVNPVDSTPADTATRPADVVRRYYDEIEKRRYDDAYALWEQSGKASRQTRAEFAAGFSQTASVTATVGDSVRMEGAAGSQYATVPVVVDAVLRNGARQHFQGSYTLRRAIADGATPEQRRWHIYSANLRLR